MIMNWMRNCDSATEQITIGGAQEQSRIRGGAKFLTQLEPPATMTNQWSRDYETCGEGLTS